MEQLTKSILLADADVLIDFISSEKKLLRVVSDELAPIAVIDQVLSTLDGLSAHDCRRLRIEIVESTTPELLRAGEGSGGLSFGDSLNLSTCINRGWICVSNDGLLLRECRGIGVGTKRGLRLLFELAQANALTKAQAMRAARKMAESDPHHIHAGVLSELQSLLDSL